MCYLWECRSTAKLGANKAVLGVSDLRYIGNKDKLILKSEIVNQVTNILFVIRNEKEEEEKVEQLSLN